MTTTPLPIPNAAQVQLALDIIDMASQNADPALPTQQAYETLTRALTHPGWTGKADQVEAYGTTRHITDEVLDKARALDEISDALYPGGDLNHEWPHGTLEVVADHVRPFVEARK